MGCAASQDTQEDQLDEAYERRNEHWSRQALRNMDYFAYPAAVTSLFSFLTTQ